MCKIKDVNAREASRILRRNGYERVGSRGSHIKFKNEQGTTIVITKKLHQIIWDKTVRDNKINLDV